jgi:murein DD-endopeptidase MepM/ murein hydrolase activator NlpD
MMLDDAKKKLNLIRDEFNNFVPEMPIQLKKKSIYVHGTIKDSLYRDALKVGLSKYLINKIIKIYSFSIDFQRGVKTGETFEVMYEKTYDEETGYVDDGVVVYAALYIAGGPMKIYLYDAPKGQDYFNEKGEGVRKALLKTPVKGARISSGYGRRRHPILGFTRMHRGVDFAAARGSPILAAGDGIVKKYGRLGGYGNYILIQHNTEYSTAYAHMHKYAKGISRGKRVKQGQVIGYVGSTGRATAPHLHYEVHHRGKQVNPQKLKMVPHQVLKGQQLEKYIAARDEIEETMKLLKKKRR